MKRQAHNHVIDMCFTLVLFCIFTAMAILVLIFGAGIYQANLEHAHANSESNAAISFVAEKIRLNDMTDSVSVGEVDGAPALLLSSYYKEEYYTTYIYEYEGNLMELFTQTENTPHLEMGRKVTPVTGFSAESIDENLLLVTVSNPDGTTISRYLNLKCS